MTVGRRVCPLIAVAAVCSASSCSTHVGNPVYVRISANCDGARGSSSCPYPSLDAALDHPWAGELEVRIAEGIYSGTLLIERDVHLTAWHPGRPAPVLVAPASDGPQALIEAAGGAAVRLSGLHLLAGGDPDAPNATHGLIVRGEARIDGAALRLEGFQVSAVSTVDAPVVLADSHVVDCGPVYLAGPGSRVSLSDSRIEQARGNAIYVLAGDLSLDGGSIVGTRALEAGEIAAGDDAYQGLGDAIVIAPDAGAVALQAVEITGSHRSALNGDRVRHLRVVGGRIADNGGPGVWLEGPDASADGAPTARIDGVRFEGNRLAGIGVSGAVSLDVRETTVSGVQPLVRGARRLGGDGIAASGGARLTGASLSVSDNSRAGLIGSQVSGLVVGLQTRDNAYGLVLQEQPEERLDVQQVEADGNTIEPVFEPGPGESLPIDRLDD